MRWFEEVTPEGVTFSSQMGYMPRIGRHVTQGIEDPLEVIQEFYGLGKDKFLPFPKEVIALPAGYGQSLCFRDEAETTVSRELEKQRGNLQGLHLKVEYAKNEVEAAKERLQELEEMIAKFKEEHALTTR